ncbi:MAG: FecR domain-containing protein [Beijerinckiaceae bacterium]|nr:FecR domain-containing protein [Beijerinckiaceae bacterium]
MLSRRSAYTGVSTAIFFASAVLVPMPSYAQDIGSAAAVNPQSQGTPPGGGTRVLRLGDRVVHNEKVQTSASGTVQILFIDKTTLNVGPNSSLVIDSFVFDPAAGTGQMVTTLTKGALRFVGGQLSHQGAATVNTPVATIGIRGGIATIAHGSQGTRAINNFGGLSIANGYGKSMVRRSGFGVTVASAMSPPTAPERVSQAETNFYLALLTSKQGQTGGARAVPADSRVSQFGIGEALFGPDIQPVQQQTTTVENVVFDIIVQGTQKGTVRPTLPPAPQPQPCSGGIC